ncbi:MAG: hypothetical protein HOK84_18705, partial [Bacteroidetes bacterium]|nr:hypothetical protein [Bacteroidota bacterium]
LIGKPMRVVTDRLIRGEVNILEIEVANTAANRLADLDIRGIAWQKTIGENQKTQEIGALFKWPKKDADWIPLPSGLIGPVRIVPLRICN